MELTRHLTSTGPRWACDNFFLPADVDLSMLLTLPRDKMLARLDALVTDEPVQGLQLAPVDSTQEIWAAGVTYMRSREARRAESSVAGVYDKIYDAKRPELFFKSLGWRAVGSGAVARIRHDSRWNVPEPELVLVINHMLEIVGYCAGNDLSSRDIEGENPLYLPQAKVYDGSCALGPAIYLATAEELTQLPIHLQVVRGGETIFEGETNVSQMKRKLPELAAYLGLELDFPNGVLLMTGTGIVPGEEFSLQIGDQVFIQVGEAYLVNEIS